jgi:ATP-dependent Clp protease ATP-binding subunit ClpB
VLRKELAEAREKAKGLKLQWDKEKASIDRVRKLREEIEASASRWRRPSAPTT